jgi:hypothetical protein
MILLVMLLSLPELAGAKLGGTCKQPLDYYRGTLWFK